MNIFVLDKDIELCVQYHCDRHVVKMQLESAQLLSTANRQMGLDEGYKETHINHPCAKWVRESRANWLWLRKFLYALEEEWRYRYGHPSVKTHKSVDVVRSLTVPPLPDIPMTEFKQCMLDKYKQIDTVQAYRDYYKGEKRHIAIWQGGANGNSREEPPWWS